MTTTNLTEDVKEKSILSFIWNNPEDMALLDKWDKEDAEKNNSEDV